MALSAISNVVSVLGNVAQIVNSPWFVSEVNNAIYYREKIENLENSFRMLGAVVEDAERKQVKSAAVQIWLERLKEVSYTAENLLEEWSTEKQKSRMQETAEIHLGEQVCKSLYSVLSFAFQFVLHEGTVHRVNKIQEQLDQIARDKIQFDLRHIEIETSVERREQTSSLVDTKEIFGREGDKQTILSKILSEGSSQVSGVPVICIAGTGGFGKTTLSQFVYNSDEVDKFQKKMWVCVSNSFDEEKVIKDIIEEADGDVPNTSGRNRLHKCLSDAVKGKLFLLVLDDVWEYKDTFWRQLKLSLDGGSPGSVVLVTTRNVNIGKRMGSSYIHNLGALSNDDCWKLFKRRSFEGIECLEWFETIGRKLSDRCKGVPLAVRLLSSSMLSKVSEQDWQNVLDSSIWKLTEEEKEGGFLPELLLSYYALSPVLKECFVYCAFFPEDMIIEKDYLVKLWMAEGFMGYNGEKNLESDGAVNFDELAMRSFFQVTKRDADGSIASCIMHDLVREFALFLLNGPKENDVRKPWRYTCKEEIGECSTGELVNLRTMIEPQNFKVSSETLKNGLVSLRALKLNSGSIPDQKLPDEVRRVVHLGYPFLDKSSVTKLPDEVGRLVHLRYLCLDESDITKLPETVCDLLNLQTLSLNKCAELASLPGRIGELSNLRHLEVERTLSLKVMPEGIGKLSHLRTLRKFIVGADENTLKIGELKHLRHLQGSLEITGLGNIVNANEVSGAALKKKNLRTLSLKFIRSNRQDQDRYTENMEIVLRDLEPPEGLKDLVIRSYPGRRLPLWFSALPNLVSLELKLFNVCVNLPCLGKLPLLKVLSLTSLISVERLGMDFHGVDRERDGKDIFPRLEKLYFVDMRNLIEWEFPILNNRRLMPCLSVLNIISCPKLNQLPFQGHEDVFPALKELHIEGCSFQLLAGVGRLKSVIKLRIGKFEGLQCMDLRELSEISSESLIINDPDVFNNLSEVHIKSCESLHTLHALGGLRSLVTLMVSDLQSVTHVGLEFLGMSNPNDRRSTSFPKLKELEFKNMPEWKEWVVPFQNKDTEFFPNLVNLKIKECNKLLALPALGKMKSLNSLELEHLNSLEHLGFVGILSDDNMVGDAGSITIFPKLENLQIRFVAKWKGEEEMMETDQVGAIKVMPCLKFLILNYCDELEVVPSYMFSDSLRTLWMGGCPNLRGTQPNLPLSLDRLYLSRDLGDFSDSLPVNHNNGYHNLTRVSFSDLKNEVLPRGFDQFTAIEYLEIKCCDYLDFTPEDFTRLSTLKTLNITWCPRLSESCRRAENWSAESRPHTIKIEDEFDIEFRDR